MYHNGYRLHWMWLTWTYAITTYICDCSYNYKGDQMSSHSHPRWPLCVRYALDTTSRKEKIDRSSLLPSVRSSTQAPAPPLPTPYSLYRDESSFAITRACIVRGMSRASRCAVSLNPLRWRILWPNKDQRADWTIDLYSLNKRLTLILQVLLLYMWRRISV